MSSKVDPKLPIIVGRATFTIDVSMISNKEANTATKTISLDSRLIGTPEAF
jgi:hypothetical protein